MTRKYVIRAHSFANGVECPHAGQYLETFDHEASNGRGFGTFTNDINKAMHFNNVGEAYLFWGKVPNAKKVRPDGKPNRPLTSLTISIEPFSIED